MESSKTCAVPFNIFLDAKFLCVKITRNRLQGKVAHSLCCNLVFYKVACICMLLTWHKNNHFSNL